MYYSLLTTQYSLLATYYSLCTIPYSLLTKNPFSRYTNVRIVEVFFTKLLNFTLTNTVCTITTCITISIPSDFSGNMFSLSAIHLQYLAISYILKCSKYPYSYFIRISVFVVFAFFVQSSEDSVDRSIKRLMVDFDLTDEPPGGQVTISWFMPDRSDFYAHVIVFWMLRSCRLHHLERMHDWLLWPMLGVMCL